MKLNWMHLLVGAAVGYGASYFINQPGGSVSNSIASNFPTVYQYNPYILAGAGVVGGVVSHGRGLGGYGYGFAVGAVVQSYMSGSLSTGGQ
jgi:hypothetical protein